MKDTRKKLILLLLALAQLLVILDSAIVNVALPAIRDALHFDQASLQWVVTAYTLTFGGFLLLGGRAADLFGRRKMLVGGVIAFTAISLLIGLSQSSLMLIVLRALQGLAAAFMSPAALSILLTTFKEGPERTRALSVWATVGAGGAAIGVFLGGLFTQYLGWQWNFFINVPLGILTVIGLMKYVPAHIAEAKDKHLDIPGAVLVTTGLMALVYALVEAPAWGWNSPLTLGLLAASAVLIGLFIWNESRAKHPLMHLSLFKIRNVVGGNLVMLPVIAGAFSLFFFSSLYIQNNLQFSPFLTGIAFLPVPIIIGTVTTWAPRWLGKVGFKPLLLIGTALLTVSTFILSLIPENGSYFVHLLPGFVIMAVGMGLTFVSGTIAATSGVPGDKSGLVSGLLNTTQQVGGALGLAVLSGIAAFVTASSLSAGDPSLLASLHGYQQAFFWASVFMFVAFLVSVFVIRKPAAMSQSNPQAVSVH